MNTSSPSFTELDPAPSSTAQFGPARCGPAQFEHPSLRVVSVPASHPYVEQIASATGVVSLPDPIVEGAARGQWWPPAALDPAWIREHAAEADLLHIHFGTESFTPEHLVETIAAAHEVGWPVIQTVHDIDHPQLVDQSPYHRQLDAMLPMADAVITLTTGAADEIARRWGRVARVLPHPRLLASTPEPEPRSFDGLVIGMYLNDLRPNIDAVAATRDFIAAVRQVRSTGAPVSGIVRMNRRVRDAAAAQEVTALLGHCSEVQLVKTDRPDDRALAASLNELDACVLPYSYGTHSGWLELCWDLAVPVAAPNVGFYSEQHGDGSIRSFERGSVEALAGALSGFFETDDADVTLSGTPERQNCQRLRWASRLVTDSETAQTHAELYRTLVRRVRAA